MRLGGAKAKLCATRLLVFFEHSVVGQRFYEEVGNERAQDGKAYARGGGGGIVARAKTAIYQRRVRHSEKRHVPLPIQNGPVFPLSEWDPPKATNKDEIRPRRILASA